MSKGLPNGEGHAVGRRHAATLPVATLARNAPPPPGRVMRRLIPRGGSG